jgi:mannose-1-phosphate guanylyltransferase
VRVALKAFLLAAGLGTRLRPITNTIPKCLVPICGRPLLSWWIELLEKHGIEEVVLNLHYLPEKVRGYVSSISTAIKFYLSYEEELLGSSGTILHNSKFVEKEKEFFILYGDNLTNYDLSEFLEFHRSHNSILSMALFHTSKPTECGIVEINKENDVIESFIEKPEHPKSNLANAGLYIADSTILSMLPRTIPADFGHDVLPLLTNKMVGWLGSGYLLDIGTHETLKKAEKEWKGIDS